MKACDVMTWGVMTVREETPVSEAIQLMLAHNISGLPVVDGDGKLVGIITEGDFLRRREIGTEKRRPRWLEFLTSPGRLSSEYVHQAGRKVGEVMTINPRTVTDETELDQIVKLMEELRIKRMPVVTSGGKPVGIVSRSDLLRALTRQARETANGPCNDITIRDQIVAELKKMPWAPEIAVTVKNGTVELRGAIMDERTRQAFTVATENVPGVKCVHDHLALVEPMSGMVFLSPEDMVSEEKRGALLPPSSVIPG